MGPEQQWREALGRGEFRLQRAIASGRVFFPPRVAEPGTGDRDWEWVSASGEGVVHSVTVVNPRPPEDAYAVVLVDLAEEVRVMSNVVGVAPNQIHIGMPVRATIRGRGTNAILLFEPA
ncbi:OB-fold domain-containing protein [Sphingomonas daechungensis]|uniref:OB-fold domain-containing protein n=1 Tax=Sphingomonas daechungensis TaxID=1176646 RepID=A0ABX6T4F3_9SPHN|nr:OB-fold domain-containing protein [Sphingomonas daechungensis]QNP42528.1 OB-fold domain-containing protein [Sphingomonas daechungensis]